MAFTNSVVPADKMLSNYFEVSVSGSIYKYKVDIEPNPPNRLYTLNKILRTNRQQLIDHFGQQYIFLNFTVYTKKSGENIQLKGTHDGVEYTINVVNEGMLDAESEATKEMFIARLFKVVQAKMRFKQVGRSYFDPTRAYSSNGLDIWPGYKTSLKVFNDKYYINIDSVSKVLRKDTAIEAILEIKNASRHDWESKVKKELIGQSVNTKYNKQIYKIDDVDFTQSPKSKFVMEDGKDISYIEYYQNKYQMQVTDPDQPLLINKPKKGKLKQIFLIPEFCLMTGLSDKQRKDFNFMRDVAKVIKPNPVTRMNSSVELATLMDENKKCEELMKEWEIKIVSKPLNLNSKKIDSGNMVMGEGKRFHFEKSKNLDRDSQVEMKETKHIKKLVIFYPSDGKGVLETFKSTSQQCLGDMRMKVGEIVDVEIKNFRREDEWIQKSEQYIDQSVQCAIYILNGPKKAGFNYGVLKRTMLKDLPVPSQMILAKTLQGKNLRSIVYRIWIQINAKLGGVPWGIDQLPFSENPTMVVGIGYTNAGKVKKSISFLATVNDSFTRYWSDFKAITESKDEHELLKDFMLAALKQFEKVNGIHPARIFVFREGAGGGLKGVNTTVKNEIISFQKGITEFCSFKASNTGKSAEDLEKNMHLVLVAVNKNIGSKFYTGSNPNDLGNPNQGTVIDGIITNGDNDFYLISQKTLQ
jgi:aubergine-like protein